jgi:hypothetical protein
MKKYLNSTLVTVGALLLLLLAVGSAAAGGNGVATQFEAVDYACASGNIVVSDEPLIAGTSVLNDAIQEPGEKTFLLDVTLFPAAYPGSTWDAPGHGVDTPDGGYIVHHRGSGTGALEGGKIVFKATPAEDLQDSPCETLLFAAKLKGVIILPPE